MGNLSSWFTFGVFSFVGFVLIAGIMNATSDKTLAREAKQRASDAAIHYIQDPRTGLCFATKKSYRGGWGTKVPCTPEVKALIDG